MVRISPIRMGCSVRNPETGTSASSCHPAIITDLINRATPIIRYDGLGDILVPSTHPCSCGSPLRHIRSLEGRTVDSVRLLDGSLMSPYTLTNILRGTPGHQCVSDHSADDRSIRDSSCGECNHRCGFDSRGGSVDHRTVPSRVGKSREMRHPIRFENRTRTGTAQTSTGHLDSRARKLSMKLPTALGGTLLRSTASCFCATAHRPVQHS